MKKLISIVTPCYNEAENIENLYQQIKAVMSELANYDYEHIFIDNCSQDNTVNIIKEIARQDKRVKLIVNSRNFGHIRSPYYGVLQASGDAVIKMASDLQDPPYLIKNLIEKWEQGYKIVKAVKARSTENRLMFLIRKLFYHFLNKFSDVPLTENYFGTGLYDKRIIEILRTINDPYPFFRGLISEIGFESATVEYTQRHRRKGKSKHNFFTLFDMAIFGIVSYSKVPLRIATILGFIMSALSLIVAIVYLILKLIFWNFFQQGVAPMIIAIFFFSSIQ